MKKREIIDTLIWMAIIYVLGVFVAFEYNPINWVLGGRIAAAILAIIVLVATIANRDD